MAGTIEFFFDYGSPAAYLAYTQMPGIAARTSADLVYRPMLLGGVFKATGNASPVLVPAKGRYFMEQDFPRFAARYGVPFGVPPGFPINTLQLMRGAIVAGEEDCFPPYSDAVYDAMFGHPRNMQDPATIGTVLREAGIDAELIFRRIAEQPVKDKLIAITEEAVARGVFGAPTCFVAGQMFFGQDRLDFVEQAAAAAA